MKRQLALLIASTVLIGSVVGGFSFAFFTASSEPVTSTLGAGTLKFTIDDLIANDDDVNNSAIIYVNNMAPGDTRESIAKITSTGTLDLIYRFVVLKQNLTEAPADVNLRDKLQLEFLAFRPDAGGALDTSLGMVGFWEEFGEVAMTSGTVHNRTLSEWYNMSRPDYQGELDGAYGDPLPAGITDYVKIRAHLPLATGNDTQAGTAVFEIKADGFQKKNRGLLASYYAPVSLGTGWRPTTDQLPFLQRIDPNIDYDWDQTNMIPGNPGASNNLYIKWTGKIILPTSGLYGFRTVSDDGVELTIGGSSVVSMWTDHGETTHPGSITLNAGEYDFLMEVYDNQEAMTGKLEWKRPGAASWQIVPQEFFKY